MGTRGLFKTIIISLLSLILSMTAMYIMTEAEKHKSIGALICYTIALLFVFGPMFFFYHEQLSKRLFKVSVEEEDEIDGIINDVQQVKTNIYNNPYKN